MSIASSLFAFLAILTIYTIADINMIYVYIRNLQAHNSNTDTSKAHSYAL